MPNFAPLGFLIKEANELANQLTHVKFQHVGRERNSVAHNLARHTQHVTSFLIWMEDVPSLCSEMYQVDFLST